ncbi:DUF4031 domain-containing protein [Mesorhizobium sp. M2A.F.Ca.ET.039.01.1.1]|uniref:DUF4031 domain-containing protein n=1 Tax=Mesorhizobium sp. M2A.F.Ca.ET.039.01.1.1 TaxID=2496746 RepID=UPI000FCB53C4|nr:DUF4031 domain-containing protein [Mesorhizobium sp. M2A.F.Ca.ET.039.01.1.1]RWX67463.1 DUF4031 domain-containing protein [Mesorhizobium sp. M2A.F.Ca.ET.039.01.1.1]TIV48118.1 MAG: DUF4031 domain-containing protein [Mesorhizobium sp.]
MSVYVDNMRAPFGKMVMCHMWADTRAELFAMADRIGVQHKWFQRPPGTGLPGMDASWEHFDIAQSKRALAVAAGAIETDKYGPLEFEARRKGDEEKLKQIAELRAKGFGDAPPTISPRQGKLL